MTSVGAHNPNITKLSAAYNAVLELKIKCFLMIDEIMYGMG